MTFPPGPPPGRSLPTWHGKRGETAGTTNKHKNSPEKQKSSFTRFKKSFHIAFRPKNTSTPSSSQLSVGADDLLSTSSTPKSLHEAPFPLLDLPRELRDRTYDCMIYDPGTNPCDKFNPPWKKRFQTRPLFYNLEYNACMLATSHQTQQEFAKMLSLRKDKSALPAVTTVLSEAIPHKDRGPYYYKHYQPLPVQATHLTFFAPFVQFLQSVEVLMEYSPLPAWTRWDPEVTIPDDVQINLTEPLISALKDGKNLRSVRIRLYLHNGKFELRWVSRELEHFKAIQGFELVQLDVIKLLGKSCSMTHTVWALPRENGEAGWRHIKHDIDFFYSWRGPHLSSHDPKCFQCWIEVQKEGHDEFPGFRSENYEEESFLKLKKMEAPEFTWDDWKKWKVPERWWDS